MLWVSDHILLSQVSYLLPPGLGLTGHPIRFGTTFLTPISGIQSNEWRYTMAVGDDATAAGYPLVPGTGEEGKVKYGAREINRTRDIVAQVKAFIPVGMGGYQTATGISYGTAAPSDADGKANGAIYFKLV
jgi:hypothetical protein